MVRANVLGMSGGRCPLFREDTRAVRSIPSFDTPAAITCGVGRDSWSRDSRLAGGSGNNALRGPT